MDNKILVLLSIIAISLIAGCVSYQNQTIHIKQYSGTIYIAQPALMGLGYKPTQTTVSNVVKYEIIKQYNRWNVNLYTLELYYDGGNTERLGSVIKYELSQE